jgi:hypothetical protein
MPSFEISGHGKSTGRKRKREVRAIDRSTAIAIVEAEDTLVDDCVELPYPSADRELLDQVATLGITVGDEPSRPECVFEVLRWCILHRRVALIVHLTDIDGNPWRATVEPHGFRRSKEGIRLRCYVAAQTDEPEVVADFKIEGWHLYLVEDIQWAQATSTSFEARPYRRSGDEISISISFRVSTTA